MGVMISIVLTLLGVWSLLLIVVIARSYPLYFLRPLWIVMLWIGFVLAYSGRAKV